MKSVAIFRQSWHFTDRLTEINFLKSWQWLRAGYLVNEAEGFVLRRNNINPQCRICGREVESVGYLASGCTGLAQREYMIGWV